MDDQVLWTKGKDLWTYISNLGLPWQKIPNYLLTIWNWLSGRTWKGLYEVLDYDATLEIKDKGGKKAAVRKYEQVMYLQDNTYAFLDQAWGDGKILVNYRCTPGVPVDIYRSGFKSHILISMRGVKNRGDIDKFHITWEIYHGFLRPTGFWASEISHHTDKIRLRVIFPKTRPPIQAYVLEKNSQHINSINKESFVQLPDRRWEITWEQNQPQLHEQFILKWEW